MTRRELLKTALLGAVGVVACALPQVALARKGHGGRRRGGRGRGGRGYGTHVISTADTIKRLGDPTWYLERDRIIREVHAAAMKQVEWNLHNPPGLHLE